MTDYAAAQKHLQSLLEALVLDGRERGIQVAAYVNGKCAVHAWAGVADAATGRLVTANTLFPVFSTTKGITATLAHLLVERGKIRYDTPVAKVWPEFGAHGKESTTVGQALSHASGIPQMPTGIGYAELCDWDTICACIADLSPLWEPGTRMEYHAMTYGWIVGEVLRRVDGRPFPQLVQEEICQPLGLDTLYVGLPPEVETQVATLEEYGLEAPPADADTPWAVPTWLGPLHALMNRPDARRACMPASNGIMNAHAIARHYAALLTGGVDGVTLLPPERVRMATTMRKPEPADGDDHAQCWGLGYMIGHAGCIYDESPAAFGHPGYGGSVGFADPTAKLAVGLTKNLFHREDTPRLILSELRNALNLHR